MHFAAKSLVGESVEKPELYWSTNVMGTRTLLNQMREFGVKKLINSSTAATYGEPHQSPTREDSPTNPTNTYGATKLAIEMMIKGDAQAYGLNAISLRYFNVAGAVRTESKQLGNGSGWLAERHNPETHLIPNVLKATCHNPIKIFGRDWPTSDGTCIRDYIHVGDLITAHIRALELVTEMHHTPTGTHQIINLGSGVGYSVQEVIDAASNVFTQEIPKENSHRRAGDPAILVADISRANKVLNWQPEHGISDMVSDAYQAIQTIGAEKKK
jgi:UDP-glucose 4-epimerase